MDLSHPSTAIDRNFTYTGNRPVPRALTRQAHSNAAFDQKKHALHKVKNRSVGQRPSAVDKEPSYAGQLRLLHTYQVESLPDDSDTDSNSSSGSESIVLSDTSSKTDSDLTTSAFPEGKSMTVSTALKKHATELPAKLFNSPPLYPAVNWQSLGAEYPPAPHSEPAFLLGTDNTDFDQELLSILNATSRYNLIELGYRTESAKKTTGARYNQEIQIALKDVMETYHPAKNTRQQMRNIYAKAESARLMRYTRCDDRCYVFLTLWMNKEEHLSRQAHLVELTIQPPDQGARTHEGAVPNHYLLLISSDDTNLPLEANKKKHLQTGFKINDQLSKALADGRFRIVDPALHRIMPANAANLKSHITTICRDYDYTETGSTTISLTESLTQEHPLTNEEVIDASLLAHRLIPVAGLKWRESSHVHLRFLIEKLHHLNIPPCQLFPGTLRGSRWTSAALKCLHTVLPECFRVSERDHITIPGQAEINDFDRIAAYCTDSPEYLKALKNQITRYLQKGHSVDACLERLSTYGFSGNTIEERDQHLKPYPIPAIKAIPVDLHNKTEWRAQGYLLLERLGIDVSGNLKNAIEGLCHPRTHIDTLCHFICLGQRHLWTQRPELKKHLCEKKASNRYLLRHLVHATNASLPAPLQDSNLLRWSPVDTLRVCHSGSEDHKTALVQFIKNGLSEGLSLQELVEGLENKAFFSLTYRSDHSTLRIEKPDYLPSSLKWQEEDIRKVICKEGLQELLSEQLLVQEPLQEPLQELSPEKPLTDHLRKLTENSDRLTACLLYQRAQTSLSLPGMIQQLHPDIDMQKARKHSCPAFRCALAAVSMTPKGHDTSFQKQQYDELKILRTGTQRWSVHVQQLVEEFLHGGHTLTYIAHTLNKGDNKHPSGFFLPIECPTGSPWSYEYLLTWLINQIKAGSVEELCHRYKNSALCLRMEQQLRHQLGKKFTWKDGLIVDGILGHQNGEPESDIRFSNTACRLYRGQKNIRRKVKDRYYQLKELYRPFKPVINEEAGLNYPCAEASYEGSCKEHLNEPLPKKPRLERK